MVLSSGVNNAAYLRHLMESWCRNLGACADAGDGAFPRAVAAAEFLNSE
jgi:hypothetical protein